MTLFDSSETVVDVETRVRQSAGPAALTAGLLILFGFFFFEGSSGTGAFRVGNSIFLLALRLGGITMIAVAVWTSIGAPLALLADSVASYAIGAGIVIGAALMLIGDGAWLNQTLYAVCGLSFLSSGLRLWRDYRQLPVEDDTCDDEGDAEDIAKFAAAPGFGDDDGRGGSLTELRQRRSQLESASAGSSAAFVPDDAPPIVFEKSKSARVKRPTSLGAPDDVIRLDELPETSNPPPEGFLADLARKQPPKSKG